MAAVTICSDFRAQENKVCHCFHCFPSIFHKVMELDAMNLVFWMLSFKPTFSLSFTFIKSLFSSSSLSATRVMLSAYLRLLLLLLAILSPACASPRSGHHAGLQMFPASLGAPQGQHHLSFAHPQCEQVQRVCVPSAQHRVRRKCPWSRCCQLPYCVSRGHSLSQRKDLCSQEGKTGNQSHMPRNGHASLLPHMEMGMKEEF